MNKVILIGQLAHNPDIRYTPSGKAMCSFSVAVRFQTRVREETECIDCVAWDSVAEVVAKQLTKGKKVAVEGRLHVRKIDNEQGVKQKLTEVVVRDVVLMEGGRRECEHAIILPDERKEELVQ